MHSNPLSFPIQPPVLSMSEDNQDIEKFHPTTLVEWLDGIRFVLFIFALLLAALFYATSLVMPIWVGVLIGLAVLAYTPSLKVKVPRKIDEDNPETPWGRICDKCDLVRRYDNEAQLVRANGWTEGRRFSIRPDYHVQWGSETIIEIDVTGFVPSYVDVQPRVSSRFDDPRQESDTTTFVSDQMYEALVICARQGHPVPEHLKEQDALEALVRLLRTGSWDLEDIARRGRITNGKLHVIIHAGIDALTDDEWHTTMEGVRRTAETLDELADRYGEREPGADETTSSGWSTPD